MSMSMRPWKIALAVVVAACALEVATATSGTPEPVSIDESSNPDLFTTADENSEFPECNDLTAGDRDRCIAGALDSFNTFYTANIDECYRPLLGSNPQTFQYVGTCPDSNDCPNYRRCTSIWGLCVTPEEVSFSNANVVPSFFDDCPPGTECVRPISLTDCSSNALGRPPYDVSTCTCADNGGVFTTQEECFNQCGAVAYAADASTGGTYTPQVCCINLRRCPDWIKYTCQVGSGSSATFYDPQCPGNGEMTTEASCAFIEGASLVEKTTPVEPIPVGPLLSNNTSPP